MFEICNRPDLRGRQRFAEMLQRNGLVFYFRPSTGASRQVRRRNRG
jgi:hypothetical protein